MHTTTPDPARIDTHHHVVPPAYRQWLAGKGVTAGGLPIPSWTAEDALDQMDNLGIATAILSVSTPGVEPARTSDEALSVARAVNDYCARLIEQRPERFGFFATLTLPDVPSATREACRALDDLGADGVIILANSKGIYAGDRRFDPLMRELDRRDAVVFIHPSNLNAPELPGVPEYAADFLLDTTRAAINIAKHGTLDDYSNIKFLLSHGGGFVPYASERIAYQCDPAQDVAAGVDRLRRFYFDTALTASPASLASLQEFADHTHLTYGSDWPYARYDKGAHFTRNLDRAVLTDEQWHRINRGNAEAIFPRLARTPAQAVAT